jgi:hypothetical protein
MAWPNFDAINMSRTLKDVDTPAGNDRDLSLKLFSGKVLEAFRTKTVFYDGSPSIIARKEISGGSSFQWPIIGDDIVVASQTFNANGVDKGYHQPGNYIKGTSVPLDETIIEVDDVLAVAMDIPHIDLDITHFNLLGPFATKMGRSMAIDNDQKIAAMGIKAARTAAKATIHKGGHVIKQSIAAPAANVSLAAAYPDTTVGAKAFRSHVAQLAQDMDERYVPETGRYLFIPPYIRRILRNELEVFDKDLNSRPNDVNTRSIGLLEGFQLVVTTSIPQATVSGYTNRAAKYNLTLTGNEANPKVAAIALCGASEGVAPVGMVSVNGMSTHMEDDHRRNTKFLKAQMLVGYGVLCPWCAGTIEYYGS